ncbi:cation diffusion facilitator family transporter [Sneathiella sp.]|uniref:cation diffusion facilitator family transporter n=1 Tax=Sneathiella sp. TaxID=1964365 RepID=UPI002FE03ED1
MTDTSGIPGDAPDNPLEENGRLMRRASYASVGVALLLILLKLGAYLATNSVAMLSTLVDSALDLVASLVNLFAIRHALTPADREHRFGHGKAEALAGLFQSAIIVGSSAFLLFQAGERLLHPEPIMAETIGLVVMVLSIVFTLALVAYQRHVIRRTTSVAISADSLHYVGDLLINGGVIAALILGTQLGWIYADGFIAIGIALVLAYSAWQIIRAALSELMDEELGEEEREQIKDIALAEPGVIGIHDLRTRRSGQQIFMQMHLDINADITLLAAHNISDAVEIRLMHAFPEAEVIIHKDPVRPPAPPHSDQLP